MDSIEFSAALKFLQCGNSASKAGLEHIRALLALLDNPEKNIPMIHVAGTNGKGSTCAMLERILRGFGKKTGLYTSPYLCRYNERVRVNGVPIPDERLFDYAVQLQKICAELSKRNIFPTAFELGTALAYLYFRDEHVDIAVIEVGLGGRLDSTNTITPIMSVIATIDFDHMGYLGDTIEKIAWEKAGIIKPNIPVTVMPQAESILHVFRDVAQERNAPLTVADIPTILRQNARGCRFVMRLPHAGKQEFALPLAGGYQAYNAALAATALDLLNVPIEAIAEGLKHVQWPGRLEWTHGFLLDGGHNPQGVTSLRQYLETNFPAQKITLVTAMMRDKEYQKCAQILAPICKRVFVTSVDNPRAIQPETLAKTYAMYGADAIAVPHIPSAIAAAQAEGGLLVIAGSLYLVGEARNLLNPDDGSL